MKTQKASCSENPKQLKVFAFRVNIFLDTNSSLSTQNLPPYQHPFAYINFINSTSHKVENIFITLTNIRALEIYFHLSLLLFISVTEVS